MFICDFSGCKGVILIICIIIQVLSYCYCPHNPISFNGDHIINPITSELNIMQPWASKQHGIVNIQYILFYKYENNNVWNTMNVDF